MKIKFSYLPEEEEPLVQGLLTLIRSFFNCVSVKQSQNHPPYKHIYVAVKRKSEGDRSFDNAE